MTTQRFVAPSPSKDTSSQRARSPLSLFRPQEEYIKEEQKNLKNELLRAQEEVKRIQVGLVIIRSLSTA